MIHVLYSICTLANLMAGLGEEGLNYQTIDNEHFLNSRIFHSLLLFCTLAKDHVNKSLFACFFFLQNMHHWGPFSAIVQIAIKTCSLNKLSSGQQTFHVVISFYLFTILSLYKCTSLFIYLLIPVY